MISMHIVAMFDIRPNLAAAGVLLLIGLFLLRAMGHGRPNGKRAWLLPTIAVAAGLIVSTGFWAVYAFVGMEYRTNSERLEDMPKFIAIGATAGLATAFVVAISQFFRRASIKRDP